MWVFCCRSEEAFNYNVSLQKPSGSDQNVMVHMLIGDLFG